MCWASAWSWWSNLCYAKRADEFLSPQTKTRWPEKAGRSPGAFFAAIVGDGIEQVKAAHIAAIDWKLDERANEIVAELCTYHCGVTVSNV